MNIVIMLILISLLILVHELGHYAAARMFGVKVSKFGFGLPIGPTLFKTKWGDTEILVHAFLLGGYVSFPDDGESGEDDPDLPADSPARFKNKKPWQKAVIFVAGVFMNVIFAIFLTIFAAAYYHKLPTGNSDVYIKDVVTKDNTSNIINANVKPGDRIVKINNINVNSSYKFVFVVQKSKYFDGYVKNNLIEKKLNDLKKMNPNVNFDETLKIGTTIFLPAMTAEAPLNISERAVSGLEKYKNPEIALIKEELDLRKDIADKKQIKLTWNMNSNNLAKALADSYKPITIVLERDGKLITIENIHTGKNGLLGLKLENKEIFMQTNNIKDITINSCKYLWNNTKMMLLGFKQLITGKIPLSEMHGILVITKVGSDIIEHQGMLNGLLLTAIISIDLAIINLLPIPALDGGHLLFLLIEKITGKKLDEKIVEKIGGFFFFLLIILMVYVIFNDIFALVTKQF